MQKEEIIVKKRQLENKPWFRFLKVVYIVAIIISVCSIGIFSWAMKPQKVIDYDKSYYQCHNDRDHIYILEKNKMYLSSDTFLRTEDSIARFNCRDDKSINIKPVDKNYDLNVIHKYDYGHGNWLGYTLLALFIMWVIFRLISIAFFYIAIGEKPQFNFSLEDKNK